MTQRILLTGASGFIGRHVLALLDDNPVRLVGRGLRAVMPALPGAEYVRLDLSEAGRWPADLFDQVDCVIHLAGVAHRRATTADYNRYNVEATSRLAAQAAMHGIRRFIFVSTVKVLGESTGCEGDKHLMFDEQSLPAPVDAYGKSKLAAEQAIIKVCAETAMQYVILRPPLVYGPGVRANFFRLLQAVAWRLPLPFAAIDNLRSMIYVENLADIIIRVIEHPAAANRTFLTRDMDISTPGLIRKIAAAFGHTPVMTAISPELLRRAGALVGARDALDKLISSLVIDNRNLVESLGWTARMDVDTAMAKTVDWYRTRN